MHFRPTTARRDETTKHITFGVDAKGRTVGAVVKTWVRGFEEGKDLEGWTFDVEQAGDSFGVFIQSTRNGEEFGASQWDKWKNSKAEQDKYVASRIKTQEKNAKKYIVK